MKQFADFRNNAVFLSEESETHILFAHPEITIEQISNTLADPDEVRRSLHRAEAKLYYQCKAQVGDKVRYICVVVKVTTSKEEFIVSAMTTERVKDGETVYRRGDV